MPTVRHEPDATRFVADTEAGEAELVYRGGTQRIAFVHTLVPEGARGGSVGTDLVEAGLAYAREHGLRVKAICPFVKAYMEAHPETQDLLA
ncbi:MAG: GNAT family N-acetyltransferase [Bacteroidota bacterium]